MERQLGMNPTELDAVVSRPGAFIPDNIGAAAAAPIHARNRTTRSLLREGSATTTKLRIAEQPEHLATQNGEGDEAGLPFNLKRNGAVASVRETICARIATCRGDIAPQNDAVDLQARIAPGQNDRCFFRGTQPVQVCTCQLRSVRN